MSGFITMQREALDHPLLKDAERFRAWFWLIAKACWKPTRVDTGGRIVNLERGQLCYSIRYLADAWGWPRTTVDRFLRRLEAESMLRVTRSKTGTGGGTAQIIITIENYSKYQDAEREDGTATGTRPGQQRDSSGTNKNKGNKGNKVSPIGETTPLPPKDAPEWLPLDAWAGFIAMRERKGAKPTPRAIQLLLRKLEQLRGDGHDPGRVLDQSTVRNWTDLYAIKDRDHGNSPRHHDHDDEQPRNPFVRAALERQAERAARLRE